MRTDVRAILIGEAPSKTNGHDWPFSGPCAKRISSLFGVEEHEWRSKTISLNLIDKWPGSAGLKGSKFNAAAGESAARMFTACCPWVSEPMPVLLLGLRVARTFYGTRRVEYFGRHMKLDHLATLSQYSRHDNYPTRCRVWTVPHPSGISHWWNDEDNVRTAKRFFKRIWKGDHKWPRDV